MQFMLVQFIFHRLWILLQSKKHRALVCILHSDGSAIKRGMLCLMLPFQSPHYHSKCVGWVVWIQYIRSSSQTPLLANRWRSTWRSPCMPAHPMDGVAFLWVCFLAQISTSKIVHWFRPARTPQFDHKWLLRLNTWILAPVRARSMTKVLESTTSIMKTKRSTF